MIFSQKKEHVYTRSEEERIGKLCFRNAWKLELSSTWPISSINSRITGRVEIPVDQIINPCGKEETTPVDFTFIVISLSSTLKTRHPVWTSIPSLLNFCSANVLILSSNLQDRRQIFLQIVSFIKAWLRIWKIRTACQTCIMIGRIYEISNAKNSWKITVIITLILYICIKEKFMTYF